MTLAHITIDTGHCRKSTRSEIDPHALGHTTDLLAAALAQGSAPLPVSPSGCVLQATAEGSSLACTVWHDEAPLATFVVVSDPAVDGTGLWRTLIKNAVAPNAKTALDKERPPQAPWCAARLEPGIALLPDAAAWLGDLERCVAWAWIDLQSEPLGRD